MYKLVVSGAYLFMYFVGTDRVENGHVEDFEFKKFESEESKFEVFYKNGLLTESPTEYSQFLDETDTPYASEAAFIAAYSNFSTASGGSEAGKLGEVEIPTTFDHPLKPFSIVRRAGSTAKLMNINVDTYRKKLDAPVLKYVDQVNGNDANTGNSWAQAYKTFTQLRAVAFDRAFIAAGNYAYTNSPTFTAENEVISVGGRSNFCRGVIGTERTWVSIGSGTWTNVLTLSITSIIDTTKVDSFGEPFRLTKLTSSAAVQATPDSWYKDTGTNTVYIHMSDGLTPSRNSCMLASAAMGFANGQNNYREGINFICGVSIANSTASQNTLVMKDCDMFFNTTTNGVTINGNAKVYFESCMSYRNFLDGFNYHESGGYNPCSIEVNCVGRNNGAGNTTSINNGSTAHDAIKVLRIGGIYFGNEGPNVHDVNTSKSLNVDCVAYESTSVDGENKSDFAIGADPAETCVMWLDNCSTHRELTTYGAEDRAELGNIFVKGSYIFNVKPGTILSDY